jgi:alginate O-acetyltransferase complex protein AlgI
LLLASIFFYSWGAPRFVFVILVTTTLDFYLVKIMSDSSSKKRRKLFLVISLCLNLGLLLYFKYCNFFIENLNSLLVLLRSEEIKWIGIALPIGISFYTFETITYVVDVYRKEHRPLSNFLEYQLYILFFPKLIAGPIIRFSQISDQIRGRFANYDLDMILNGFFRFVLGLSKKVFLANTIGLTANAVFSSDSHTLGTADCWIGAIAYSFQIYFDFSGYSDMAIGLAKMFGFRFPENFENPYTANSITEFWKRWHISLGSWMKNYLYISFGGNRVSSNKRLYFNLGLVFLLCGFWHGAAWTFIVWGLFYGAWLILEKIFL